MTAQLLMLLSLLDPRKHNSLVTQSSIGSASDVFKTQFSGDWKDNKVITLEDVDEVAFGVMLLYIYTDEIKVKGVNLLEVLQLAHLYMMHDLVSALTSQATFSKIALTHVWKYLMFACEVNDLDLVIRCLEVIECNESLLSLPDFLKLKPTVIALIIGRNSLVCSEYELFCRVFEWSVAECQRRNPSLEPTPGNLRKVMESFIRKIRFPVMSLHGFSKVEKTGVLNGLEVQQIRSAISSKEKDKTGFDFNPRVGKSAVQNLTSDTCYSIMSNVIVRATYEGKTFDVCIACALECHGRISMWMWYPSFGVGRCNCRKSGQCVLKQVTPRIVEVF